MRFVSPGSVATEVDGGRGSSFPRPFSHVDDSGNYLYTCIVRSLQKEMTMVVLAVILWFLACTAGVYAVFWTICWAKKTYTQTENLIIRLIEYFECEDCKKSCEDHRKLVRRALLWGTVI